MTNEQKIDAYRSAKSRSGFIDAVSRKYGISKTTAGQMYYKAKTLANGERGGAPTKREPIAKRVFFRRTQTNENQTNDETQSQDGNDLQRGGRVTPQTITPQNVESTTGEVLSEDESIKRSYNRMLGDMEPEESVLMTDADDDTETGLGKHKGESKQKTINNESGDYFEDRKKDERAGRTTKTELSYNPGHLVGSALKSINNHLIWPERPLSQENVEIIDGLSQDVNARHIDPEGTFGNDPNADLEMLLLAGLAIPALENIDLWPAKATGVVNWLKINFGLFGGSGAVVIDGGRPANQKPQVNNGKRPVYDTTPPEQQQAPESKQSSSVIDFSKYSPNVANWLMDEQSKGTKIDPSFRSDLSYDIDSYKKQGIIKNYGSAFS